MAAFHTSINVLLGGLLAASLTLAPMTAPAATPDSPDSTNAGITSYYTGDYDTAIRHLRIALGEKPADVNLRYYLADALAKQGRLEEARLEYRRIVENMPDSKAAELSSKALGMMDSRFKRWTVSMVKVKTRDLDWEVSAKIRYPDPVELQKELGKRIQLDKDVEAVSFSHLSDAKAQLAKLPPGMVNSFLENKGEIRVIGSLMSVERTTTHKNRMDAAGLCDVKPNGQVLVYLTVQGLESDDNVALHEMGHAMDFLAGKDLYGYGFSHSEEFKALYQTEPVQNFLGSLRNDGYYLSAPQESFAQLFSMYFDSEASRRHVPYEVQRYFQSVVIPHFEQKTEEQAIQF